MKQPETISRPGRLARAGEWLSVTAAGNRVLGAVVIGPNIQHVAYKVSATPADEVPESAWATFPGSWWRMPLPWPRCYTSAGLVWVNSGPMNEMKDRLHADLPDIPLRAAVAFRFGKDVMAAEIGDEHPDQFAMGLGWGENNVTAGFVTPDHRLWVPENAVETDPQPNDPNPVILATRMAAAYMKVY